MWQLIAALQCGGAHTLRVRGSRKPSKFPSYDIRRNHRDENPYQACLKYISSCKEGILCWMLFAELSLLRRVLKHALQSIQLRCRFNLMLRGLACNALIPFNPSHLARPGIVKQAGHSRGGDLVVQRTCAQQLSRCSHLAASQSHLASHLHPDTFQSPLMISW